MGQITIADIHTRINGLKTIRNVDNVVIESSTKLFDSKKANDIIRFIESVSKSNANLPFYNYLLLFESVCKHGTKNDINRVGNYIIENEMPKVRDSKATNSLIKRRLTLLQHKISSPISKSINDAINASNNGIDLSKYKSNTNEETMKEMYNKMLDKSITINHCDRILENYSKISRRFNLDKLFIENTRKNGIEDTIINLCEKVDTYDMPTYIKFNTVIETAWYGFESNNIEFNKTDVLNSAVDYFAFKADGISECTNILEATVLYNKDDMKKMDMDILTEEEPEDNTVSESTSFKDIFNKFKKEELADEGSKPESKLKTLINKLYTKNVDGIVAGTPDLLHWVRRFFIIGTGTIPVIGPVLMCISYIVDRFMELHVDRKELPKMIKCFEDEIKKSKDILNNTEDKEEKERLEKYIKSLEEGKKKLKDYYGELFADGESPEYDFYEDEDFDDFDDFDFDDFLESNLINKINNIITLSKDNIITEESMYNLVNDISNDDLINLSNIANRYPEILYADSILDSINDSINSLKNDHNHNSNIDKLIRISTLESAKNILNKDRSSTIPDTIFDTINEIDIISNTISAVSIMIDTYNSRNSLLEASFVNTLKVASMKLKNAITKMNDKQKAISKNVDLGMNNLKKGIERSLTNDNRESIIKGSILPSFSKVLKLCIVNASLVALHQPQIAVITTLGYFAVNQRFKAKERQMVIDEIEIELEMCEKYINIAEQKNDMVALKQLLTTKKELERQRQRIKYKMKVDFGQKYYDSKATGDNN